MRRLLIGSNPTLGQEGIWLSVPGVDVTTATLENQFLLSPDFKNEQILMTGMVTIGNFSSAVVFFPEPLPSPPMIAFQHGIDPGFIYQPWKRGALTNSAQQFLVVTPSQVTFQNFVTATMYVYYVVMARDIGG